MQQQQQQQQQPPNKKMNTICVRVGHRKKNIFSERGGGGQYVYTTTENHKFSSVIRTRRSFDKPIFSLSSSIYILYLIYPEQKSCFFLLQKLSLTAVGRAVGDIDSTTYCTLPFIIRSQYSTSINRRRR